MHPPRIWLFHDHPRQPGPRSLSEYLLVLSHGRWISLGFGLFGLGPTLMGALSPSIYPDAAGATPDLQKIVGQAYQLPLGRHFLQASQQKLADSSRGLDHAEYRLDDVLCAA